MSETEDVEGKYLVQRRDGTIPTWPSFVLGARDLAAPAALRAYADECDRLNARELLRQVGSGYGSKTQALVDVEYIDDIRNLAKEFEAYRDENGPSVPKEQHRKDDPATISKMQKQKGQ